MSQTPRQILDNFLKLAQQHKASDLHLIAGSPVLVRLAGELVPISLEALNAEAVRLLTYSLLTEAQIVQFERELDFDLMVADKDANRFRVNVSYNAGAVGAVIRLLPRRPLALEDLKLPALVTEIAQARKGLILVTGSTSQGKSTTMAAMIDYINRRERKHIVTIEDPVEYAHENKLSVIRQRAVGHDTKSFQMGLRAALRQDPNVVLIGEMRDYDTISTSLVAAETGVLVISSLHVISTDKIIARLISYAPEGQDVVLRELLAESLICVIHQELLSTVQGGKRVAAEVMLVTDAVRNVIRSGAGFQLRTQVATGKRHGMQSMKTSLDELLAEGAINEDTYRRIVKNYQ